MLKARFCCHDPLRSRLGVHVRISARCASLEHRHAMCCERNIVHKTSRKRCLLIANRSRLRKAGLATVGRSSKSHAGVILTHLTQYPAQWRAATGTAQTDKASAAVSNRPVCLLALLSTYLKPEPTAGFTLNLNGRLGAFRKTFGEASTMSRVTSADMSLYQRFRGPVVLPFLLTCVCGKLNATQLGAGPIVPVRQFGFSRTSNACPDF